MARGMQLSRRQLLRIGGTIGLGMGLGGLLAACAGRKVPAGPVDVSFWHGQAGPLGELLDSLVAKFNAAHPDIKVAPEFVGGWLTLNQKVLSAVSAQSPPVLSQVGASAFVHKYVQNKVIVPLAEFAKELPKAYLDDVFQTVLDEATYVVDGKPTMVSWPFAKAVHVMFYNGTVFEQQGIKMPTTWPEVAEAAKGFKKSGPDRTGIAWTPDSVLFGIIMMQHGGEFLDLERKQVRFNEDSGVEALSYLKSLVDQKLMILTKAFDFQQELQAEKAGLAFATIVSKPYILTGLNDRFQLGVAEVPATGENKVTVHYGPTAVLFEGHDDHELEAGWEFLKWWNEPANAAEWSLKSGYVPIRRSVLNEAAFKQSAEEDPSHLVGLKSLEYARALPNIAAWAAVETKLVEGINKALLGLASPKAALDEAAEAGNALLRES